MWPFVVAIAAAFGVVFIAELGDKTQLLALGFGARHRLRTVALGLAIGYGAANLVATIVGAVLGATLPERPIAVAAGLAFLGFALWTLRPGDDQLDNDDDNDKDNINDNDNGNGSDGEPGRAGGVTVSSASSIGASIGVSVVSSIALSIAIAELGDKTQLATAALAARNQPVGTWIGATAGAATAGLVGAALGQQIGRRLSARALRHASAALFAIFGVALLVTA